MDTMTYGSQRSRSWTVFRATQTHRNVQKHKKRLKVLNDVLSGHIESKIKVKQRFFPLQGQKKLLFRILLKKLEGNHIAFSGCDRDMLLTCTSSDTIYIASRKSKVKVAAL